MDKRRYLLAQVAVALVIILQSAFCFAQAPGEREVKFIYESGGKRDPFIPLADDSGIRTDFSPPKEDESVTLPFEIEIKGILWNGKEYFAILNDKVCKKGERLGQVEIINIERNKVALKYSGKEFSIFLKKGEK